MIRSRFFQKMPILQWKSNSIMSQPTKKYQNSPIVECICEFQFIPSGAWDVTFPGQFYVAVKDLFPVKEQKTGLDISFGNSQEVASHIKFQPLIQFFNDDKKRLLQLDQNLLTINVLKPYPHWEIYYPLIIDNLGKYINVMHPVGYQRVSLRYLNKIDILSQSLVLPEYFNFSLSVPEKFSSHSFSSFQNAIEFPFHSGRDVLAIRLLPLISDKAGSSSFLLEIQYIMNKLDGISMDETSEWLNIAHQNVNETFESCITDKLRKSFDS